MEPPTINIPAPAVGSGLAQPPKKTFLAPDLQTAIAQHLGVLGGMSHQPTPARPTLVVQDQPIVRAPEVKVPSVRVQPFTSSRSMPLKDQKMLDTIELFWALGEDAHEFPTDCHESLHT